MIKKNRRGFLQQPGHNQL